MSTHTILPLSLLYKVNEPSVLFITQYPEISPPPAPIELATNSTILHPSLTLQLSNLLTRLRLAHVPTGHRFPGLLGHSSNIPLLLPRCLVLARSPRTRILDRLTGSRVCILSFLVLEIVDGCTGG